MHDLAISGKASYGHDPWWVKKVSCWFLANVNKTEDMGGMWTNMNSYRENEALSDIFTWNIFCVTIVLRLNILWLKAVNKLLLGKHELAYVNMT